MSETVRTLLIVGLGSTVAAVALLKLGQWFAKLPGTPAPQRPPSWRDLFMPLLIGPVLLWKGFTDWTTAWVLFGVPFATIAATIGAMFLAFLAYIGVQNLRVPDRPPAPKVSSQEFVVGLFGDFVGPFFLASVMLPDRWHLEYAVVPLMGLVVVTFGIAAIFRGQKEEA